MIKILAIACAFIVWFWVVNNYIVSPFPLRLILNIVGLVLLLVWIGLMIGIPI